MAEPHELEERACQAYYDYTGTIVSVQGIRAVLDLVRQEQEIETRRMVEDAITAVDETNIIGHDVQRVWRAMIRAWWLSHTAPQEK